MAAAPAAAPQKTPSCCRACCCCRCWHAPNIPRRRFLQRWQSKSQSQSLGAAAAAAAPDLSCRRRLHPHHHPAPPPATTTPPTTTIKTACYDGARRPQQRQRQPRASSEPRPPGTHRPPGPPRRRPLPRRLRRRGLRLGGERRADAGRRRRGLRGPGRGGLWGHTARGDTGAAERRRGGRRRRRRRHGGICGLPALLPGRAAPRHVRRLRPGAVPLQGLCRDLRPGRGALFPPPPPSLPPRPSHSETSHYP